MYTCIDQHHPYGNLKVRRNCIDCRRELRISLVCPALLQSSFSSSSIVVSTQLDEWCWRESARWLDRDSQSTNNHHTTRFDVWLYATDDDVHVRVFLFAAIQVPSVIDCFIILQDSSSDVWIRQRRRRRRPYFILCTWERENGEWEIISQRSWARTIYSSNISSIHFSNIQTSSA